MSAPITMSTAKRRLARTWFIGAGLLALLVAIQSVRGVYADETGSAWAWLLPSVMPTLSLIIGVLVVEVGKPAQADVTIDPFFPRLTQILSVAYLVTVSATILLQPVSAATPLGLMTMSHFWLAPFQGLVSAAMGAFFARQDEKKSPTPATSQPNVT